MMMQPSSLMRQPFVVLATVAMLLTAAGAQAQTVRFKTISDAVPLKYFNAATTMASPKNTNSDSPATRTSPEPRMSPR